VVHKCAAKDWMTIYWFTSLSQIFLWYWDVTIAREGLQTLDLCSALKAFEQDGIFIMPHLLWLGASAFPVSSEGPPHLVAAYDWQGGHLIASLSREGSLSCHTCCDRGSWFFPVSSKGPPHLIASYDWQGYHFKIASNDLQRDAEDLF
jgi:hypothetical protein